MLPSVAQIDAMDRADLTAAWITLFDTPVPKGLSQPFLRRFLAFEVQARTYGGLPKGFLKNLERLASTGGTSPGVGLKPGGRLLREWNGVTHVVDIGEDGFRWNGQHHSSLSSVARAITGARWSGPRFFGLKEA